MHHKAKVLHEFTRFMRPSNSTDHLRWVANIFHFAPPPPAQNHHIGDDSITEMDHILIQDVIAVLLQCEGILFLGITQVNSIRVDKIPPSFIPKDLLNEDKVSLGIQILSLKPSNSILLTGRKATGPGTTVMMPASLLLGSCFSR